MSEQSLTPCEKYKYNLLIYGGFPQDLKGKEALELAQHLKDCNFCDKYLEYMKNPYKQDGLNEERAHTHRDK